MANLPQLTDENFAETMQKSQAPVLVDFSADWCQPCKALAPTIEAIAEAYRGRLEVYSVDAEEAQDTAGSFGITGLPTCIFFKDGQEVDRFSGNQDLNAIKERVEKILT